MEVAVVGGIHDGVVAATAERPAWGFIGPHGAGFRVFAASSPRRELYRLSETVRVKGEAAYLTAERTHAQCSGCGGFTVRGSGCHLCGTPIGAA